MITLRNDRLRVELAEPGESPNNGCRFDRAGFVTEVVLDGDVRFCGTEPKNMTHPSSGGRGFCSEYILDLSAEARVGEYYPKLGVGLIRKEDCEPYLLHRRYSEVIPFEVTCVRGEERAVFTTRERPCLGYAAVAERLVSINGNWMTMSVRLENRGKKPLCVREYCHNFISIDGMAISPEYSLCLSSAMLPPEGALPDKNGAPSVLVSDGSRISFCGYSPCATGIRLDPTKYTGAGFEWRLEHFGARAYVRGVESFRPDAVSVWFCDHIVSPEVFITSALEPGQTAEWHRTWEFGRLQS